MKFSFGSQGFIFVQPPSPEAITGDDGLVSYNVADVRLCVDGDLAHYNAGEIFSIQRYNGQYIGVNGEMVDPEASGPNGFLHTNNAIGANGLSTGSAVVKDVDYYVYFSNSQASYTPRSLGLSLTAPTLVSGIKYLGSNGNAANWRFIGWVRLVDNGSGGTKFVKNQQQCFVVNYYNPEPFSLINFPDYHVSDLHTYAARTETAVAPVGSGDRDMVEWLNHPLRTVSYAFEVTASLAAGKSLIFGVAENSGPAGGPPSIHQTSEGNCSDGKLLINNTSSTIQLSGTASEAPQLLEGYSFITGMVRAPSGGVTMIANVDGGGTGVLITATYIRCTVLA